MSSAADMFLVYLEVALLAGAVCLLGTAFVLSRIKRQREAIRRGASVSTLSTPLPVGVVVWLAICVALWVGVAYHITKRPGTEGTINLLVLTIFVIAPALTLFRWFRFRSLLCSAWPRCSRCLYDLTGHEDVFDDSDATCPECGQPFRDGAVVGAESVHPHVKRRIDGPFRALQRFLPFIIAPSLFVQTDIHWEAISWPGVIFAASLLVLAVALLVRFVWTKRRFPWTKKGFPLPPDLR